ncbi:MAG: phosphonate metabolism protein/1,5-bisphosphokinase (PRPP-forming) PhnN [Stappiaceae bacterium]
MLSAEKIGPGVLALVVGPSGAGKDTLLDGARDALADRSEFVFIKRQITRKANPLAEDHDCISEADYERLSQSGQNTLCWRAHGLGYVLPFSATDAIREGHMAIANGSRAAIPMALRRFDSLLVVHVTAPNPVLAERLAKRGRESAADIRERLERANLALPSAPNLLTITNDGSASDGINALVGGLMRSFAKLGTYPVGTTS